MSGDIVQATDFLNETVERMLDRVNDTLERIAAALESGRGEPDAPCDHEWTECRVDGQPGYECCPKCETTRPVPDAADAPPASAGEGADLGDSDTEHEAALRILLDAKERTLATEHAARQEAQRELARLRAKLAAAERERDEWKRLAKDACSKCSYLAEHGTFQKERDEAVARAERYRAALTPFSRMGELMIKENLCESDQWGDSIVTSHLPEWSVSVGDFIKANAALAEGES